MSPRRLSIAIALALLACRNEQPAAVQKPAGLTERASAIAPATTPAPAAQPAKPPPPPCPEQPNVLIIVLDTVRADATQLDGRGTNRTPALAALAARGVNFSHAYSTWDSTPPSHFSILTGYVNGHQTAIDQPEASLAHQLAARGYRTFGVVANGNLSTRFMRALMPFRSYENVQEEWEAMPAADRARKLPPIDALIERYDSQPNDWYRMFVYSSAAEVLHRFEKQLDTPPGQRAPFFGFLNLIDAHDPYFPAPYDVSKEPRLEALRYRTLSPELAHPDAIADPERKAQIEALIAKAQGRAWSVATDVMPEQLRIHRKRYDAEVREADAAVGRIVEALRRRGLLDNTLLVITADHGESFGEGGLLTHSFNNSGDVEATRRVPLLFVMPPCYGHGGMRVRREVTIADIAPTLYQLLGIDASAIAAKTERGNFGRSLLALFGEDAHSFAATRRAQLKATVSEEERAAQDREAKKRFRSLGYLQ